MIDLKSRTSVRPQHQAIQGVHPTGSWQEELLRSRQLHSNGSHQDALRLLERLLRINPSETELWVATSEVLLEMDEAAAALNCLRQALSIDPLDVDASIALGNVQLHLGNRETAEEHFQFVLDNQPGHAIAMEKLSSLQSELGEEHTDLERTEQVDQLALRPTPSGMNSGSTFCNFGRIEATRKKLIEALPNHPRPAKVLHMLMATMNAADVDSAQLESWEELAKAKLSAPEDRAYLHFAQGKIADDLGQYDVAFEHYRQANELVPVTFDLDAHRNLVDRTIELWTPEFIGARSHWGLETSAPIFIVGMPRSGTTLVEQILSSHSQIHSFGERTAIQDQIHSLSASLGCDDDIFETAKLLTQADVYEFAEDYLNISERGGEPFFTDRTPSNFLYLGWIALNFPDAKIIHCERDLRDACLSGYFQHSNQTHSYACRLDTLAAYALESARLMDHWKTVMPDRIINVRYEQLVESPQVEIRRLLAACDLDVEPACLQPHRQQRSVATMGEWQAQQPIYKTSLRRWEKYSNHLQPLLSALRESAAS